MMLVLEGVSKRYGETMALDGIDVAMSAGHVHTVLGENGSGKSTLVKLLSGVVRPDRGHAAARQPHGDPGASGRGAGAWVLPQCSRRCCWRRRAAFWKTSSSAMTG